MKKLIVISLLGVIIVLSPIISYEVYANSSNATCEQFEVSGRLIHKQKPK